MMIIYLPDLLITFAQHLPEYFPWFTSSLSLQYSGPSKDALSYVEWLKKDEQFSDIPVQISPALNGHAFPKLKLRYKPSLVQARYIFCIFFFFGATSYNSVQTILLHWSWIYQVLPPTNLIETNFLESLCLLIKILTKILLYFYF